jgi:sterol desaturase/sphingolipid hydroxylase (fatty acid hydroxylase superfamily)
LQWDVLSPAAICAGAAAVAALERALPFERQRFLREGFFTDLFWYALVQGTLVSGAARLLVDRLGSPLPLVSGWPIAAQVAFFLVLHDFAIYWFHRYEHRNPWLWRLHEAHHAPTSIDWIATARRHALELFLTQVIIIYASLYLLGAAPATIGIIAVLDSVWGMWIHANVDVRSGWLQRIINGPEMHRYHHSANVAQDVNFASKLACWDWMFGTAHLPRSGRPGAYGLGRGERFPDGYFAQLRHAFRPRGP